MMGVEKMGAPGALRRLPFYRCREKGRRYGIRNVGGLSGTFIPVSEDSCMNEAVRVGALSIENLRPSLLFALWGLI